MIDPKVISLLAVVKYKSFTKAAQELSITQPAVSHHISQLESDLGVSIFLRKKKELVLTEAGKLVVKYAQRMNAVYCGLQEALADRERHITRLRIGITHTAESNIVAEILAKYGSKHSDTLITIFTAPTDDLYTMLKNYELDLAIVEGTPTNPSFNSLLLDTDSLVCVAANSNPISKRSMVTISDLCRQRMILRLPKSGTVNLLASCLESINRSLDEFNVILEVDNIATIKDLIRKNMGVSILPQSTCMDEVRKGKLTILPIENLSMIRQTNIVYLKDFSHPDVLQEITRLYRQAAKEYSRVY